MAVYELTEKRKHKKFQLYKRLTETGLLDSITDDDFKKHGMSRNTVINDVEKNYSALLENIVDNYENEGAIVDSNKAPVNFTWTDKNRPLTSNTMENPDLYGGECYIFDSTKFSFEKLRETNAYPKAVNNISSSCKTGNDNFKTHNNTTFARYFEHVQGTIRPLTDRTLDAWYDVGLDVTMYQSGIPYTATGFQKSYYVWYIKGDGTDYPYLGQIGYIYPGQEANFPIKYRSSSKAKITAFTHIDYRNSGETPFVRNGTASEGFYAKLEKAGNYAHGVVKVNLGKLATLGQKWHYQGFTIRSYPVFDVKPTELILQMKGDDVALDITDKLETSLTWEFDEFSIESEDPTICKVEHDWIKDPNTVKYYVGPSYIRLIGNGDLDDATTTITVKAKPKGSSYVETFTFKVKVEQLYKGVTSLNVTPNPMIVRVGETLEYNVETNASDNSYKVSSNVSGLLRVYKGKITGVKVGKGILEFYAQATNSRPATVNVSYRVDAYVPEPKITPKTININVEVGKKTAFSFETNCPRANITTDRGDFNTIDISSITWASETKADSDPLNTDYPISTGTIEVLGKKIGTTKLYLTGYVAQNDNVIEVFIIVNVLEATVEPDDEEDTSDKLATLNDTDAYWGFHDQAQGQFTYLRSKTRSNGLLKNKIFVIPKPSDELLAAHPEKEFTLALVEDLTRSSEDDEDDTIIGNLNQNPNYLDWKEKNIPNAQFDGQPGTVENETYIATETLELFRSQNANVDHKHWISANGVMVGDIWYKHQGEKGFGVGPAPLEISTYYGLTPLAGCWDPESVNYGNYTDVDGNIMVYIPRHYVYENYDTEGKMLSIQVYYPVTMDYSNHSKVTISENGTITDEIIRDRFNNDIKIKSGTQEYENIKNKLILPRCFINENKVLPGIFVDKYPNGSFEPTLGTATYSRKDALYFGSRIEVSKTSGTNINNGKFQPTGIDAGIASLFATINRKKDTTDITDSREVTYFERRGNDITFITPFVRNMLNRLALAHAYGCNTLTSPNNCAWLSSTTAYINNVVKDRVTSINNVTDSELALGSHNGQACGVYGLNTNILEACIGAYQTLTGLTAGTILNGFTLNLTVTTRNLDVTSLAKSYATLYNNSTTDEEKAIPNHISGRQPDNGNGYGMNTFANLGFKGICLTNNQTPTGTMLNMKDNVPSSSIWDLYNSNCYKYNLGFTGSFIETTETVTESSDINKYNYNSRLTLDHALININLGDHKIKYYTGWEDTYPESDITGGLIMNFIPLYGGILENKLTPVCVSGTADAPNETTSMRYTLASTHAMSCTWYRLGYDPANNKGNLKTVEGVTTDDTKTHTYFLPVTTRRMILPDMDTISEYVTNGTYGREMKILYTKSYNTFGSKLLTKENNDPWGE